MFFILIIQMNIYICLIRLVVLFLISCIVSMAKLLVFFERVGFTKNGNTKRIDHFAVPCKCVRKGDGRRSLQAFARFVKKNFPFVDQIELDMKVDLDPTSKNSLPAWINLFSKIGTERPTSNDPKHINVV